MRKIALVVTVLFSLALFGCPDKQAQPDPSKANPSAATTGAKPATSAGAAGSAKGGW